MIRCLGIIQRPLIGHHQLARPFQTSPPRNVPPLVLAILKPASRIAAVLFGRRFRKWWKKLPPNKREVVERFVRNNKLKLMGAGVSLAAFVLYAYESHIQICPITNRRRFVALKPNQMEKIAATEFEQLLASYEEDLLPAKHPSYGRVARVTNRILESNKDLPQLYGKNWTISVVEQGERNAFVLPTGNIFVFTGMLDVCTNDDQLGIVLSHEIAHTLLNHVAEKLSYINVMNILLMVPMAVLWAFIPNDGIGAVADWFMQRFIDLVVELPFSRDLEAEADEVGLTLAAKACLDVREAPAFWGKMSLISEDDGEPDVEFLSTHPAHATREETLLKMLPTAIQTRASCGCQRLGLTDPNEELEKFRKYLQLRKKEQQNRVILMRD